MAVSEGARQRQFRETRYTALLNNYTEELRRSRQEDINKFNGLQTGDMNKKLSSPLYLAPSKEGQNYFAHKNPEKKILDRTSLNFGSCSKQLYNFRVWNKTLRMRVLNFSVDVKKNESLEKIHETLTKLEKLIFWEVERQNW